MPDYLSENIDVFCDGGSRGNPGPAASAFVMLDDKGVMFYSQSSYLGESTNNVAEYQAVEMAVHWLENQSGNLKVGSRIIFHLDSLLVVNQLNGVYKVKDANLRKKYTSIIDYLTRLRVNLTIDFKYIPRSLNTVADRLVNETLDASM